MITPHLKDKLLKFLVENAPLEKHQFWNRKEAMKDVEIDDSYLQAMLYQFERLGLLESVGVGFHSLEFVAKAELHDFYLRGGFTVKEELLEKNIEKLMYEIDVLKNDLAPSQLDTANKIGSIAQGIGAALQVITTIGK